MYLAAVEEGPEHCLAVWDWARAGRLVDARGSSDTVVAVEFHPLDDGAIVTCGRGHVTFWQLEVAQAVLNRRTGVLEPRDTPKYFTCLAFATSGDLITGDSSGNVLVWARGYNGVTKALWGVHEGPVFVVCVFRDGSMVTGGGKDRRAVRCDAEYRPTGEEVVLQEEVGGVRSVVQGEGRCLVVGTTGGCLLRGSLASLEVVVAGPGEVASLAPRPGQHQFLTGGASLALWDSLARALIWSHDLGEVVAGATFSPDGERVVAGLGGGRWVVVDSRTRELVAAHQVGTEALTTAAYSPDGRRLVLGSRGALHVYRTGRQEEGEETYARLGSCRAPAELLAGLDWAADSVHLAATTADRWVGAPPAPPGRWWCGTPASAGRWRRSSRPPWSGPPPPRPSPGEPWGPGQRHTSPPPPAPPPAEGGCTPPHTPGCWRWATSRGRCTSSSTPPPSPPPSPTGTPPTPPRSPGGPGPRHPQAGLPGGGLEAGDLGPGRRPAPVGSTVDTPLKYNPQPKLQHWQLRPHEAATARV